MAVEDLAIGDKVVTLSGMARRVKWIGHRAYDGRFRRRQPRGAADPGRGRRRWPTACRRATSGFRPSTRSISTGALVPAGLLVNGVTIRQVESVDQLEYFHIEFDSHDVILADGAPAETFVDCDSRGMFHNAGEFAEIYPDDVPVPWEFCAPRAEAGSAALAAIRAALAERAQALGHGVTDAADPRAIADGEKRRAQPVAAAVDRLTIPAAAGALAIAACSVVPAEVKLASSAGAVAALRSSGSCWSATGAVAITPRRHPFTGGQAGVVSDRRQPCHANLSQRPRMARTAFPLPLHPDPGVAGLIAVPGLLRQTDPTAAQAGARRVRIGRGSHISLQRRPRSIVSLTQLWHAFSQLRQRVRYSKGWRNVA